MSTTTKATSLLLFLCMVLMPSCGKFATPEAEATTTVTETLTEETMEPLPNPLLHADIIADGVSCALFEFNEATDKAMSFNQWYLHDGDLNRQTQFQLSYTKAVFIEMIEGYRTNPYWIILRDREVEKEIVLLEGTFSGHYSTSREPFLSYVADERYVLISWDGWDVNRSGNERLLEYSVIDINTKKNVEIAFPSEFMPYFVSYADGWLYFVSIGDELLQGEFNLQRVKLNDIKNGKLEAFDVPTDATFTVKSMGSRYISGKYFAAPSDKGLFVFDIEQRACVLLLNDNSFSRPRLSANIVQTIYRCNGTHYLIEITLP